MHDYLFWVALGALLYLYLVAPLSGWAARHALRIWPDSGRASLPLEIAVLASVLMAGIWMTRALVNVHPEDWMRVFALLGALLTVPLCFVISLIGASKGMDGADGTEGE